MKKVRPIRIDGDVAYVTLTKGYVAVIDAADVHLVDGFNWCAAVSGRTVYASGSALFAGTRRKVRMHRILVGAPKNMEVDHRDGDGLNNKRDNLRLATKSQNMHNRRLQANNTSGVKGVSWHRNTGKWVVYIASNCKRRNLGYYSSKEDAHAAYQRASEVLHGEFGRVA